MNTADFAVGQTPGLLDLGNAARTFTVNDGSAATDLAVGAGHERVDREDGAGTLRLDSPNAYAGGTTVSAGTLDVIDPRGPGSGGVALGDGTLSLRSDLATPVPFGNDVTVTGDGTIKVDRVTQVGATTGAFRLGRVTLGGTRLTVGGANRTLEVTGLSLNGSATLDTGVALNVNGTITEATAGSGWVKSTGTAKLTLGGSAANTYTGLTLRERRPGRAEQAGERRGGAGRPVGVRREREVAGGRAGRGDVERVGEQRRDRVRPGGALADGGVAGRVGGVGDGGADERDAGRGRGGTAVLRVNGALTLTSGASWTWRTTG